MLRQLEYFSHLKKSAEMTKFLVQMQFQMTESIYRAGETIINIGDRCKEALFVLSGKIEIIFKD